MSDCVSDCDSAAPSGRSSCAGSGGSAWANPNVRLTLFVKSADGLSAGIWNGATLAAYIYLIQNHSNKSVGIAEGIFGTFCAASGIPAGWCADRIRRDRTLRFCGIVMLVAIAATITALLLPPEQLKWRDHMLDSRMLVLVGAMVLWGIAEGYTPVLDAIFADSVPTGGRAGIYTLAFSAYVCFSSAGQFIAAALFWANGNTWSVHLLAGVILVGMAVALIPAFGLGFFDDDQTLGEESEALLQDSNHNTNGVNLSAADVEGQTAPPPRKGGRLRWRSINFLLPAILLSSDAVFGLAAGMTVKFFPIFFKEAAKLSPASTNVVMAVIPLVLAPLSFLAQHIGNVIGRVPTIMAFESIGVTLMGVIGIFPSLWPRVALIVPMVIIRSAANNCCYALQKSLLMDYVRKEERGRWNSLDCVLAFGWSGSAVVGGFLLDSYGFDITFSITASLQGVAVLMLCPLLFILPHDAGRQPHRRRSNAETCRNSDCQQCEGATEQLLHNGDVFEDAEAVSEAAAVAAGENLLSAPLLPPSGVGTRNSLERQAMADELCIDSYEAQRYRMTPE